MKKVISALTVIFILFLVILPASAAMEKVNVMSDATLVDYYGLISNSKFVPDHMWDGLRSYNADISATYCDFKFAASAADARSESVVRYNIYGQTDAADSDYLCVFTVALDKVYPVSQINFFGCLPSSSSNIDGFDIWVSETGAAGSWTKVFSEAEIYCGRKFETYNEDGLETVMISGDFNEISAGYILFGLSQPRCLHTDELAKYEQTPNANTHYFRISEIEIIGLAEVEETTEAPATTEKPTTQAPATTENPTIEKPADTQGTDETDTLPVAQTTAGKDDKGCASSAAAGFAAIFVAGGAIVVIKKESEDRV